MKQLHPIQIQILSKLLFSPKLNYTQMKPSIEMDNNQFDFHLDKLITVGYIEKLDQGYQLTKTGKEYANRIDTDNGEIKMQAKIGVMMAAIRRTDELEALIYTRLKHPFYGCQGLGTGKVRYGDQVMDTAVRELEEETGLQGEPKLVQIRHYRVYEAGTSKLLEDKFMYICVIENPTGEVQQSDEGKYEWVKESQFKNYVTNHFESWESFSELWQLIKNYNGELTFVEIDHWSEKF